MENQASHEKHIQHQFDSYCKIIAKNTARNCYKKIKRRNKNEILLSVLSDKEMSQLQTMDKYFNNGFIFNVLGYEVIIHGKPLAEALMCLAQKRRNIILLYYFLGLNDRKISELLNLVLRTVNKNRLTSLKQLNNLLKGGQAFGEK